MALWQEIVTTALVGTERQAALPSGDGRLGDLLTRLHGGEPTRALLSAAATTALHRRASRLAATDARPLPAPCPPEDQPRCNPRAAQRLATMLAGQHQEVLPEWLAAVAAAGQRVPETHLPALLHLGRAQAVLREAILPVLGARGRWLAAQNDAWDYAAPIGESEATWQTGSRGMRLALLQRLRGEEPARARELVASTWAEETPDDRAAFLGAFATGLSMADEPFLEAALDDRRKEVRSTAVGLLARLPESRLVQRMIERVQPLLTFTPEQKPRLLPPRAGKKAALDLRLPEACDKAMIRDGIDPKPPSGRRIGEKAWWLQQMLGVIPPAFWSKGWNTTAIVLLEVARRTEWKNVLLQGWIAGTHHYRDADWAEAFAEGGHTHRSVTHLLPLSRWEAFALRQVQARMVALSSDHPAQWLLFASQRPMGAQLGQAVITRLYRSIRTGTITATPEVRGALKGLARHLPPARALESADSLPTDAEVYETWTDSMDEFLAVLQFRYDMLKEIAE